MSEHGQYAPPPSEPHPDEIDFDRLHEHPPSAAGDNNWLMQVWKDHCRSQDPDPAGATSPLPPERLKRPLYQRDHSADGIRNVWASNIEEEFKIIRQIVARYPYIAMDTEFPGIVARPLGEFNTTSAYQYQSMRCNVGMLQLIQLGLTFHDSDGAIPPGPHSTWQFNFKFSLTDDMYAQDSINLLHNSGIQFEKHATEGIRPDHFAELLMTSGVVLMDNVVWLSFHSGYDFGYLLKLLTNMNLPEHEGEFFELLRLYFPNIYDVKHLMESCHLTGGLQDLATHLQVTRAGTQHQAGSDSLVTGRVFFKLRQWYFNGVVDEARFAGHLYGLDAPT